MKKALKCIGVAAGTLLVIGGIVAKIKEQIAFSIIGSADGPTAVFIAGTLGDDFSIAMLGVGSVMVGSIVGCSIYLWKKKRGY